MRKAFLVRITTSPKKKKKKKKKNYKLQESEKLKNISPKKQNAPRGFVGLCWMSQKVVFSKKKKGIKKAVTYVDYINIEPMVTQKKKKQKNWVGLKE
ncbi:MAG: hypothetical protein IPN49_15855 [Saprospiraceae bacterium]|nr:hypothetical protein [Saprospiraceae bacterium]